MCLNGFFGNSAVPKKKVSVFMWLLQGVFFQNNSWLDTAYTGDGLNVVIKNGLIRTMFFGCIFRDWRNVANNTFVGEMSDQYGTSVLSDVFVSLGHEVRFTKKYQQRPDLIHYTFIVKEGGVFVGEYSGPRVGNGIARCILTPIQESFFDPASAAQLLGKAVVHTWSEKDHTDT